MSPVYGYKCSKCGEVFERKVGYEEFERYVRCPKCDYLAYVVIGAVNHTEAMKWPSDRREHFQRVFEGRRCERPKAFG